MKFLANKLTILPALGFSLCLGLNSASATTFYFDGVNGSFNPHLFETGNAWRDAEFRLQSDREANNFIVGLDAVERTASVSGGISFDLFDDQTGEQIGEARGEVVIGFDNIRFNETLGEANQEVFAIGVEGESNSEGSFHLVLDFYDLPTEAEFIDVYGGYANVGPNNPNYGFASGTPFNFILFDTTGDGDYRFDLWVKSLADQPFTISNQVLNLHGDIHGAGEFGGISQVTNEVPEPGTILLLGMGAVGLALRRRSGEALA